MLSGLLYSPNWTFVDKILRDPQLVDLEYFVGGGPGHDWLAKTVRVDQQKYLGPRAKFERQFNEEPKTWEVVTDNLYRLTLLAGVERLLTLRQAYGGLKTRFTFGDSNTACLQQIFNQGLFKGYFRGALLNAAQFLTVWAHPLVYSRGNGYASHYLYSSLFELITYPIDTIKTIIYSDHLMSLNRFMQEMDSVISTEEQYLSWPINGTLIYHLRNIYEQDYIQQLVSVPLLAIGYGFLTIKTRLQLASTDLSFQETPQKGRIAANLFAQKTPFSIYRGVIPFLLLTDFFHYKLFALYSSTAQSRTLDEFLVQYKHHIGSPKDENLWQ
ncbi:unnamed protein product (macronuclear) [Paramecium tetraurelia]|uniref:Uncharacterized protein n=1 Tax=Paramecium tetraurelia TaxID=5888 RepID=A0CRA5_PARTE|nr:uncharacterized protein GSPATT00009637001 [Paramecium tetraurelia]CAK73322.1 unnamed protein product [Paramecium tetraurelia]|eukprot:XP_001440719.1 hypothetical protein (macronuclear) [Paramecium tetraurelia strain d4-2]